MNEPCPTCGLKQYAPAHFEDTNAYIEALEARALAAEAALEKFRTPADDRQLAEIRAALVPPFRLSVSAWIIDARYLLSEVGRLKGTLASYADGRTVKRRADDLCANCKHPRSIHSVAKVRTAYRRCNSWMTNNQTRRCQCTGFVEMDGRTVERKAESE